MRNQISFRVMFASGGLELEGLKDVDFAVALFPKNEDKKRLAKFVHWLLLSI